MSRSNSALAHELFYMKHGSKTELSGSNFYIRRGLDYTVAYSYSTPIAVYPDHGGFVLMDAYNHSSATSKHQSYLRQAIPANTRCISFEWLGCNSEWQYYTLTSFKELQARFVKRLEQKLATMATNEDDYAYSQDRIRILNTLQGLHHAFAFFGKKRPQKLIEKKERFIKDPERIKQAQKKHAAARAEARERKRKEDHARQVSSTLRTFLNTHGEVMEYMKQALLPLLASYPVFCLRKLNYLCFQAADKRVPAAVLRAVVPRLEGMLDELWKSSHDGVSLWHVCDLHHLETKPGYYITTKSVTISHAELQRCLRLWSLGQLLGEKVENSYPVLHNNENELVIGCHTFRRETVRQIHDRYYNKDIDQITEEDKTLFLNYRLAVAALLADCTTYVLDALKQDEAAAAILSNELTAAA